jgi:hypothetical protein
LKKNQAFRDKNMKVALREVFLKMDELLQTTEGQRELLKIKNNGQASGIYSLLI